MLPSFCYCAHLRQVETRTAVDVVMHFREGNKASSTAQLALLTLPRARVHRRGAKAEVFDAEAVFLPGHQPLYLFPAARALPLTGELVREMERKDSRPFQLIVPDGSWSQAKKIQERERAFWRLPCVSLQGLSSRYRLRRAPRKEGLATFEAIAHALGVLEGPERVAPLFDNFDLMVEQNLKSRGLLAYNRDSAGPRARIPSAAGRSPGEAPSSSAQG